VSFLHKEIVSITVVEGELRCQLRGNDCRMITICLDFEGSVIADVLEAQCFCNALHENNLLDLLP
jgi:hypothetical protein